MFHVTSFSAHTVKFNGLGEYFADCRLLVIDAFPYLDVFQELPHLYAGRIDFFEICLGCYIQAQVSGLVGTAINFSTSK